MFSHFSSTDAFRTGYSNSDSDIACTKYQKLYIEYYSLLQVQLHNEISTDRHIL